MGNKRTVKQDQEVRDSPQGLKLTQASYTPSSPASPYRSARPIVIASPTVTNLTRR